MRRCAVVGACVLAGIVALAGCGGDSGGAADEDVRLTGTSGSSIGYEWADASADLALYCLKQATDGTGDVVEADSATDTLVSVARAHPDAEYSSAQEPVTFRQALSDEASDLDRCDPVLAEKLDRALATLD